MRPVTVLALAALCCCDAAKPAARLVRVQVADERGAAVSAVPVEVDGITATTTGESGRASVSLAAEGPPRARIRVVCPTAFRPADARQVARVQAASGPPLELAFRCRPRVRTLVVVARVRGGQGLVLRADGEAVGTVGADGTLHAVLTRPPDTDVRLMLDTEQRALTPRDPTLEFRVADRDELIVFDRQLTQIRRRVSRVTSRPSPPAPHAPVPCATPSAR